MRIKLTVIHSDCRSGYHHEGDSFTVGDLCPPVCHELWHAAYPYVFALLSGAQLDQGDERASSFTVRCPDGGRVVLRGEKVED